nr:MAG TPA: replication protein O [Caudoviricetes sp.]
MAEVELKNGYLKISNSLFDNLFLRDFNKRELVIISLILRLSYGFNKKYAIIKPKSALSICGLYPADINKTLNSLIKNKVIHAYANDIYEINKNFDEWLIGFSKNFDEVKLTSLKSLQFEDKILSETLKNDSENLSKTLKNNDDFLSETLKENEVNYLNNFKQNTKKDLSETLKNNDDNLSKTLKGDLVKHLKKSEIFKQNTYTPISKTLKKNQNLLVKHLKTQRGNADIESVTGGRKYIIKDILNTYLNTLLKEKREKFNNKNSNKKLPKNFDPFLNNPIVEIFKQNYKKILKKRDCYLDAIKINRLTEIYTDRPEIIDQIPDIITKYSKIRFTGMVDPPSLKWLINEGGWAGILNGEYDQYMQEPTNERTDDGWTL